MITKNRILKVGLFVGLHTLFFGCADSLKNVHAKNEMLLNVTGIIENIENGKDGYSAKLVTDKKETYHLTVSVINFNAHHSDYKRVIPGELVTVNGNVWKDLDGKKYMRVNSFKE